MTTLSAARFFSEAFTWLANLSSKLPRIDFKTFFIVVVALVVGVGAVVGLTYFGSYRFKLRAASKKIIQHLNKERSIDDDNVKDFTEQCFSQKAPAALSDSWKLYLGVRFGYPSDIVSERTVYDDVVKRVREVRANVFVAIALVLIAVFAFWGYGVLDGNDMGVIFCTGLALTGVIYLLLIIFNRMLSKSCLEVFNYMQIELDAKVDLQVDKSYATDSSPLADLAAIVDEIIARNTAKDVGFGLEDGEETPIEKLIASAAPAQNAKELSGEYGDDGFDGDEFDDLDDGGQEDDNTENRTDGEGNEDKAPEDITEDNVSEDTSNDNAQDGANESDVNEENSDENAPADQNEQNEENPKTDGGAESGDIKENINVEKTVSGAPSNPEEDVSDENKSEDGTDESSEGDTQTENISENSETEENKKEEAEDVKQSQSEERAAKRISEEQSVSAEDSAEQRDSADNVSEESAEQENDAGQGDETEAQGEENDVGDVSDDARESGEEDKIEEPAGEEVRAEADNDNKEPQTDDTESNTEDEKTSEVNAVSDAENENSAEDEAAEEKTVTEDEENPAEQKRVETVKVVDYSDDDSNVYVRPAKLVKLPKLVDYVLASDPTHGMLISISTLLLSARDKFENSREDLMIVDDCIGKLIVALQNAR